MKQGNRKTVGILLMIAVLGVQLLAPQAVEAKTKTAKYMISGINFYIPTRWKYAKADNYWDIDDSTTFYLNSSEDPRLTIMHQDMYGDLDANQDDLIDSIEENFDGTCTAVSETKVAGYPAFIVKISGKYYSGKKSQVKVVCIKNTDKDELIRVYVVQSNASIKRKSYLRDANWIAKNAKKKKSKYKDKVLSEKQFEKKLNAGADMTGRTVKITVKSIEQSSWSDEYYINAGDSLRFFSEKKPKVKKGNKVKLKITSVSTNLIGEWVIRYKIIK